LEKGLGFNSETSFGSEQRQFAPVAKSTVLLRKYVPCSTCVISGERTSK